MKKTFIYSALIILLGSVLTLLFFSDPLLNRFVKPKITETFAQTFPGNSLRLGDMSLNISANRFSFDSIVILTSNETMLGTVGKFSISGITWRHLLFGGKLSPEDFAASILEADDIVLNFQELQYHFWCERIYLSVPDSTVVAESLEFRPAIDDESFFRKSKFSQTRFTTAIAELRINGLSTLDLLQGKIYRARSASIHDLFLDLLVNNDKPGTKTPARMPHEILSSFNGSVKLDTVTIVNGRVKYAERMSVGSPPAVIAIDDLQLTAEGISNLKEDNNVIVLSAQGRFMQSSVMNLQMTIPVHQPEFTMRYSGSLGKMDIAELNTFLEIAEQTRIKSGTIEKATFKIEVNNGRSSGEVQVQYKDLKIAVLNKTTGSAKGFMDGVASFIANTFTIRTKNMPDKSGKITTGKVNYVRKKDDPFFRFVWFSLRSGLKDVVGF